MRRLRGMISRMAEMPKLFCVLALGWIVVYGILLFALPGGSMSLFFSETNDFMSDFFCQLEYSQSLSPYNYSEHMPLDEKTYLPLTYLISYGLIRLGRQWVVNQNNIYQLINHLFMLFSSLALYIVLSSYTEKRQGIQKLLAFVLLFSGFFWSVYERGQFIILTAAFLGVFLFFYRSRNVWLKEAALVSLALAAALKCSPAFFGLLLVYEKDYKSVIRLFIYGVLFCLTPFGLLEGGFSNFPLWMRNARINGIIYSNKDLRIGQYQHLFYLEQLLESFGYVVPRLVLIRLLSAFAAVPSVIGLGLFWTEKCEWRRMLLLLCCILFALPNCNFYNAIYLFPVIVVFLNDPERNRWKWFYLLFFLVQLVGLPQHWFLVCNSLLWDAVFAELLLHAYFSRRRRKNAETDSPRPENRISAEEQKGALL